MSDSRARQVFNSQMMEIIQWKAGRKSHAVERKDIFLSYASENIEAGRLLKA